jgi:hypothetical protein
VEDEMRYDNTKEIINPLLDFDRYLPLYIWEEHFRSN